DRAAHAVETKRLANERTALNVARQRWEMEVVQAKGVVEAAIEQARQVDEERAQFAAEQRRLEREDAHLRERRNELERLRQALPLDPKSCIWDLDALTQLVEERADEFPTLADEWRADLGD